MTFNFYFFFSRTAHNAPNAGYPQQPAYHPNPAGGYPGAPPQQGFVPSGQPVVNNYYGSQPQQPVIQSGGSSGGSFLQTALAAGAGSLAGNALYGAFKPHEESKTVIIHENSNQAPNAAAPAPAPAAPAAAPVPAPGKFIC